MDKLSPIAMAMNSVPGNTYRPTKYKWVNTKTNYLLGTLNKKELREIYGLESIHFENSAGYYIIKVNNNGEQILTHDELLKELEL